jgi:hypothetical protein
MVASLQCRCRLETATIKHRIERNDDQIEPFFDNIEPKRTSHLELRLISASARRRQLSEEPNRRPMTPKNEIPSHHLLLEFSGAGQ